MRNTTVTPFILALSLSSYLPLSGCVAATGDAGTGSGSGNKASFGGGYGVTSPLQGWSLAQAFEVSDGSSAAIIVREEGRAIVIALSTYDAATRSGSSEFGPEHGFKVPRVEENSILDLEGVQLIKESGAPDDMRGYEGDLQRDLSRVRDSTEIRRQWARACGLALASLDDYRSGQGAHKTALDRVRGCHALARAARMHRESDGFGVDRLFEEDRLFECEDMKGYLNRRSREVLVVGENRVSQWVAHWVAPPLPYEEDGKYVVSVLPAESEWSPNPTTWFDEETPATPELRQGEVEQLEGLGTSFQFANRGLGQYVRDLLINDKGQVELRLVNEETTSCRLSEGLTNNDELTLGDTLTQLEKTLDVQADDNAGTNGRATDYWPTEEKKLSDLWGGNSDDESGDTGGASEADTGGDSETPTGDCPAGQVKKWVFWGECVEDTSCSKREEEDGNC